MSGFFPPEGLGSMAIFALFLWNIFASMEDVAVDAVAVMLLSEQELGAGNVGQVVGYKLGAAFAGGVLALLAGITGWLGVCIALTAVYTEAAMLVYVSPLLRLTEPNRHSVNSLDDHSHEHSSEHCMGADPQTMYSMHHHHQRHHHHCQLHQHGPGCCHQRPLDSPYSESTSANAGGFAAVLNVMSAVFRVPDTLWTAVFLLIYKLGMTLHYLYLFN